MCRFKTRRYHSTPEIINHLHKNRVRFSVGHIQNLTLSQMMEPHWYEYAEQQIEKTKINAKFLTEIIQKELRICTEPTNTNFVSFFNKNSSGEMIIHSDILDTLPCKYWPDGYTRLTVDRNKITEVQKIFTAVLGSGNDIR